MASRPPPPGARIINGKWILRNKLNPDGTLERRKACWVVRGDTQLPGVNFDQTFSPIVKPATIRIVLTLSASHGWPVHQLDVKNAFLHGELRETVYCRQPTGFVDPEHPDYVCLLSKSLYGLRQAPRAWYSSFAAHLRSLGFTPTGSDTSLFILRRGSEIAWLLLYVDDIVLTASSSALSQQIVGDLSAAFAMKDLGPLHYFLGVQVSRTKDGFFLHQQHYAEDVLERAGMLSCKPAATPVDTKAKLSASEGELLKD
jgi:hypothetical protein